MDFLMEREKEQKREGLYCQDIEGWEERILMVLPSSSSLQRTQLCRYYKSYLSPAIIILSWASACCWDDTRKKFGLKTFPGRLNWGLVNGIFLSSYSYFLQERMGTCCWYGMDVYLKGSAF